MKRFRFRFEAVERARRAKEGAALRALGSAQGRYQAELTRKKSLLSALSLSLGRREQLGREPTLRPAFELENDFIAGQKLRVVQADQAILRATRAVEKALRAYLAAKRQLRAIEKLRELHYLEFRRELAKREKRELDDLHTMRAGLVPTLSLADQGEGQPGAHAEAEAGRAAR
jgi:flagellar export protein FliJ